MDGSMPRFPVLPHLLEFAQTHVHWVQWLLSNHLILCCSLLFLPSFSVKHYLTFTFLLKMVHRFLNGPISSFICFYDRTSLINLSIYSTSIMGFPGGSVSPESACNVGDLGSNPGRGGINPWRRAWKPTPVFLPEECLWTEEPGGLWTVVHEVTKSQTPWATKQSTTCLFRHHA